MTVQQGKMCKKYDIPWYKRTINFRNFLCDFIVLTLFVSSRSDTADAVFIKKASLESIGAGVTDNKSFALYPAQVKFLTHDLALKVHENKTILYSVTTIKDKLELTINFTASERDIIANISDITISVTNHSEKYKLPVFAEQSGHTVLTVKTMPENMSDDSQGFVRISVYKSLTLDYISDIVGWGYFAAWSISFYPQIWLIWKRKSVIGLHFDFLGLNTMGFFVYSIFNIGLYFIPEIENEYFEKHPFGVNPVQLNDVIFSVHAFFTCLIIITQCQIYERGDQKVSRTARSLLGTFTIASIVMLILASVSAVSWINFLYFLSYIKLFITLIKYIPQAYYNYLRKSTSGWSIGNVLLDFTGGTLSIVQMILISFNYNDWGSIFGDPTKFGLGMFSVFFDIFFIIQHYILYRGHENYIPFSESNILDNSDSSNSQAPVGYGSVSH